MTRRPSIAEMPKRLTRETDKAYHARLAAYRPPQCGPQDEVCWRPIVWGWLDRDQGVSTWSAEPLCTKVNADRPAGAIELGPVEARLWYLVGLAGLVARRQSGSVRPAAGDVCRAVAVLQKDAQKGQRAMNQGLVPGVYPEVECDWQLIGELRTMGALPFQRPAAELLEEWQAWHRQRGNPVQADKAPEWFRRMLETQGLLPAPAAVVESEAAPEPAPTPLAEVVNRLRALDPADPRPLPARRADIEAALKVARAQPTSLSTAIRVDDLVITSYGTGPFEVIQMTGSSLKCRDADASRRAKVRRSASSWLNDLVAVAPGVARNRARPGDVVVRVTKKDLVGVRRTEEAIAALAARRIDALIALAAAPAAAPPAEIEPAPARVVQRDQQGRIELPTLELYLQQALPTGRVQRILSEVRDEALLALRELRTERDQAHVKTQRLQAEVAELEQQRLQLATANGELAQLVLELHLVLEPREEQDLPAAARSLVEVRARQEQALQERTKALELVEETLKDRSIELGQAEAQLVQLRPRAERTARAEAVVADLRAEAAVQLADLQQELRTARDQLAWWERQARRVPDVPLVPDHQAQAALLDARMVDPWGMRVGRAWSSLVDSWSLTPRTRPCEVCGDPQVIGNVHQCCKRCRHRADGARAVLARFGWRRDPGGKLYPQSQCARGCRGGRPAAAKSVPVERTDGGPHAEPADDEKRRRAGGVRPASDDRTPDRPATRPRRARAAAGGAVPAVSEHGAVDRVVDEGAAQGV